MVSSTVQLEVQNPNTFVNDANAQIGFNRFWANYIGVSINELDTSFRLLSSRLRRLQTANIEAEVTISLPPERGVNKAEVRQKLEDMGPAQNALLRTALEEEGATGYNLQVHDVTNIQEGTATTTSMPKVTTEEEKGLAGGSIAFIVVLCLLVFSGAVAAIHFFLLRKRMDNNLNTNNGGMVDTNADNSGEIPEDATDDRSAGIEVRAGQFQVKLPQVEDGREAEEPETTHS